MFCMRIRGADVTWGLINNKYVENNFLFLEFQMFAWTHFTSEATFGQWIKHLIIWNAKEKSISTRCSNIVHRINHPLACFTWYHFRSLMIGIAAHKRVNNNIFLSTSVRAHTSPSNVSFIFCHSFISVIYLRWIRSYPHVATQYFGTRQDTHAENKLKNSTDKLVNWIKFVHEFIDIYDVHIFGWALHFDSKSFVQFPLRENQTKQKERRENRLTGTKQKTNDYFISVDSSTQCSRSAYIFCVGSM